MVFVDIHTHILPGCDDGAQDKETALDMLRIAAENRTGHMIATPHFIPGKSQIGSQRIMETCRELQSLSDENGLNLKLFPGCEAFLSPELPDLYDVGLINTLGNSAYMLVELPMMSIPPYTDTVLYQLQLKGLKPVLAHPERNREIIKNPGILRDMIHWGIFAQINTGSLLGIHGRDVKRFAWRLLGWGMVHFIASDAHSTGIRRPNLSEAAALVEKKYGRETMQLLFHENGLALLENRPVLAPEPVHKRGGILCFLSGRLDALFKQQS